MKWHWNEINQECEEFHYGGCLGNGNRFDSKQQYMNPNYYPIFISHLGEINFASFLEMLIREGYYNDDRKGHWWYYFNATDGDCHRFFYYGCGGNDNRFYSHYHCKKVCGERLAPDTASEAKRILCSSFIALN
uniref:BPTI/Kunitz inhibitor domain-containing protein n=1 Tax=Wuchereria bancrofti TaxID=6293 RepID=A0A1I8EE91_WUCBA